LNSLKNSKANFRFKEIYNNKNNNNNNNNNNNKGSITNVSDSFIKVDTVREGESIPDEVLSENLKCGDTLDCRFASSSSDVETVSNSKDSKDEINTKHEEIVTYTKRIVLKCPKNCRIVNPSQDDL